MLQKIIKEPLFHFLFAGFLLFLFFEKCSSDAYAEDTRTIVVQKEDLLTLMQYRSKAFQGDYFDQKFEALSEAERQQLIHDYVQEEALYREAQQLNLGANDYIIKRRMIQKVDFMYQNRIEQHSAFSEDSLLHFFNKNKEKYREPTLYTFSHIFFKANKDDLSSALKKATVFLKNKNMTAIDFNGALQFGERFLYHHQYVEKDLGYIAGHFGAAFAKAITALPAHETAWSEPIQSEHGYHLLLLTDKKEEGVPDFLKHKSEVIVDYKRGSEQRLKADLMKEVIGQYQVIIDL